MNFGIAKMKMKLGSPSSKARDSIPDIKAMQLYNNSVVNQRNII
jgi:hypothetical protein